MMPLTVYLLNTILLLLLECELLPKIVFRYTTKFLNNNVSVDGEKKSPPQFPVPSCQAMAADPTITFIHDWYKPLWSMAVVEYVDGGCSGERIVYTYT